MKKHFGSFLRAGLAALSAVFLAGCGGDDDDFDYGDNDPNLVACVGDSLTQGYNTIGAPYPTRLAQMSGKTVLNYGVAGTESSYGAGIIGSVLARKPGTVCIMYGSNDAIMGRDFNKTKACIKAMAASCKANNTRAVVAVPPGMVGSHAKFNHRVRYMADFIREAAKEEGVKLIDFYSAMGDDPSRFLNPADGLHLSDEGADFVAKKFNSCI